jgi:hypothetical protein
MKRLLAGIACLALCVGAFAQGTVSFNNSATALGLTGGAPVFDADGTTRLAGTAYVAQLFAGPDIGSLAPWGDTAPFRTGAGAGFWNPGADSTRIIGSVAPGQVATIVVRAWEAAGGTYVAAVAGGFKHGSSTSFTVATGGVGSPPSLPTALGATVGGVYSGLTSFSLVPEPSTYALLALGAAALALRRRKA